MNEYAKCYYEYLNMKVCFCLVFENVLYSTFQLINLDLNDNIVVSNRLVSHLLFIG